jgi:hypothetical protein
MCSKISNLSFYYRYQYSLLLPVYYSLSIVICGWYSLLNSENIGVIFESNENKTVRCSVYRKYLCSEDDLQIILDVTGIDFIVTSTFAPERRTGDGDRKTTEPAYDRIEGFLNIFIKTFEPTQNSSTDRFIALKLLSRTTLEETAPDYLHLLKESFRLSVRMLIALFEELLEPVQL